MIYKKYLRILSIIFVTLIFFFNAQIIMQSVKQALFVCYEKVIPSLFLFMVFSSYVSKGFGKSLFAVFTQGYCKLLKIEDKNAACYLSLSLISGFAVGGKFLGTLSEKSQYNQKSLGVLSIAMINNSVSFVAFGVGIGMLGNYRLGLMLFASLTLASLVTAFLFSFLYQYEVAIPYRKSEEEMQNAFTISVQESVQSMMVICGFVIIFYCICEVIILYVDNLWVQMIACGLTEVTTGCIKCLQLVGKNPYILCVILSIIPISTACQVKAFAGKNFSLKTLFVSRVIHTPLSLMFLSIFINLFPTSANVYSNNQMIVRGYWNSVSLSSTLFLISLIFILFVDKNKVFTKKQ